MGKGLDNILSLYEEIFNQKNIIQEAAYTISGIDELVYNPATRTGGTIGYGYDKGRIVKGITWAGHENHLHIGFTNKDVAMKVIDKAQAMGLRCTENPYAKGDPNGKVDRVHTSNSFHYKNFEGQPLVGAGVDITGDTNKITELIKWVENTYGGKNYDITPTDDTGTSTGQPTPNTKVSSEEEIASRTPELQNYMRGLGQKMYPQPLQLTMKEQTEFGKKPQLRSRGVKIVIPKENNQIIKAPYDGVIDNTKYFPDCKNRTTLKLKSGYHLIYCGLSNPIKNGKTVILGDKLGNADEDITVSLYDEYFSPVLYSDLKIKGVTSKENINDPTKGRGIPKDESLYSTITQIPFRMFQDKYDKEGNRTEKRIGYATDKVPVDPWIVNAISKPFKQIGKFLGTNKSVNEELNPKEKKIVANIEKIKRLIK